MSGGFISAAAVCVLIALAIVKFLLNILNWKRQNVEVVNVLHLVRRVMSVHFYKIIHEIYQQLCADDKPFKVIEMGWLSAVVIRDQDVVKDVLITKFEDFAERGIYVSDRDPLLLNLLRLKYGTWKPLRKHLSPSFSPVKLKNMFGTIAKVSQQFTTVLMDRCSRQGSAIVEMHDICSRFAIDVIGNVAFGIECNSLIDPQADFKIQGDKALRDHFRPISDLVGVRFPWLMTLFNKTYHTKETTDFFTNLIKETVKHREEHNIKRHDFVDILIELRNEMGEKDEVELTPELMVGQAFLFFTAGYESISVAMAESLYELAKHPAIQDKAREEVFSVLGQHNNELCYEVLGDLKYIKQICQETQRKYPLLPTMQRHCLRPCTLHTTKGSLNIKPGTTVFIPVYGIHHNPEFYPNPEQFYPERFDEQKLTTRPQCTSLSYGDGPKMCIAQRFAMMELQCGLAALLSKFRFNVCAQTPKELVFDKKRRIHLGLASVIYIEVEPLKNDLVVGGNLRYGD